MTSPPPGRRLLLAFLVAPLAAPVVFIVGAVALEAIGFDSMPSLRSVRDLSIGVFALGTPTAYAAALVGGVPAYFLLRKLGLENRWTLWAAGAAIGAAVALLLAPHLRGDFFSVRFPWWVGASIGVVSAETFWRLLGREPDGPFGDEPVATR